VIAILLLAVPLLHLTLGSQARADDDPPVFIWRLTQEADGIRSYAREAGGSALLAFRGEVMLDAPIERVLSVVLEAERVGEWIPYLTESTILRWIDPPREYIQFTRFDPPWPVRDRVFLSRVLLEIDPQTGRTTLAYRNAPNERLPSRAGESKAIQGFAGGSAYLIEPVDDGRATRLFAISVADPKGTLPAWLINWIGSSWAHETMTALRAQIEKPDVVTMPWVRGLYREPHAEVEGAAQ
jgi:hypothetical protein